MDHQLPDEEALALDPKDTSAKSAYDSIATEIKKKQLQKDLAAIFDEARKEITAGHFTAALKQIRKAEALSPGVKESASLRNMVATSREQDQLRLAADLMTRRFPYGAASRVRSSVRSSSRSIVRPSAALPKEGGCGQRGPIPGRERASLATPCR